MHENISYLRRLPFGDISEQGAHFKLNKATVGRAHSADSTVGLPWAPSRPASAHTDEEATVTGRHAWN